MIAEKNIQPTKNQKQKAKAVLEIKDLHKSFGDNHVLNGFNLTLHRGENLVIMGKSGSGKSVMIKCLVGLMEADEGSITVMGKDIRTLTKETLDELRIQIGFLFQGSALYDSMTVRENLEFPLRRHKTKISSELTTEDLVIEALKNVGLADAIKIILPISFITLKKLTLNYDSSKNNARKIRDS